MKDATLRVGTDYPACVVWAGREEKQWKILLCHLDPGNRGRRHVLKLSSRVMVNSLEAEFFRACGVEVRADASADPLETVGKRINVRFGPSADGVPQIVSFATYKENS